MCKRRGIAKDDLIFYRILPDWNAIFDDAQKGIYANPEDSSDATLLIAALKSVCQKNGWEISDFEDYQKSLRC